MGGIEGDCPDLQKILHCVPSFAKAPERRQDDGFTKGRTDLRVTTDQEE
jgi:hypothetical protein